MDREDSPEVRASKKKAREIIDIKIDPSLQVQATAPKKASLPLNLKSAFHVQTTPLASKKASTPIKDNADLSLQEKGHLQH
ncbi:hypothetical protein TNCT_110301 [Trichonephila clavata]|uniref:Uncharacterized protein n=1 Tax=Trichonephila clavata TaxID=2740835 RepID=A0A8X6LKG3_TRICU|nr:hypothetical protein TNCT_110301 [Trichonephila clavata]